MDFGEMFRSCQELNSPACNARAARAGKAEEEARKRPLTIKQEMQKTNHLLEELVSYNYIPTDDSRDLHIF